MNIKELPIQTAANLSMFMVNVAAKLRMRLGAERPGFSVLDVKARYRGYKYLHETIKRLPQKPEPIVIQEIAEHLGTIGAVHYTPTPPHPR